MKIEPEGTLWRLAHVIPLMMANVSSPSPSSFDLSGPSPEEAIGEDTSFEAFYTTLYINAAVGLLGFVIFCVLRPLRVLGFRQFFAPVCFTARNRVLLETERRGRYTVVNTRGRAVTDAEARRLREEGSGPPFLPSDPAAGPAPESVVDTSWYPLYTSWFGWILPTLKYIKRRLSHSHSPCIG